MNAPWPEERVGALAPDASSLGAARALADRWRDTGYREDAVWGRCRGSGPEPYATIVDLSGPAYSCDCPSRKTPCKHALSLLLLWSHGAVAPAAEVADFAAEWLAWRASRTPKPAAQRTANPATAEQRRVRVTAGLEELDIWLGDQVRTGLAQADRSYQAFETIAARMVDAQAPGVARALRRLPLIMATRADWPEPVLREYARLHLLVAAHRRLDGLAPALRASVRTHIGYPNPAEAVRGEPLVRDQWMTLGVRSTEDDRLYTRRTWLYGRRTHRWALLVDHAFGTPAFPATAPVLGHMAEADLHYYPGAAPLRALWGERLGTDEPFTTLPAPPPSTSVACQTPPEVDSPPGNGVRADQSRESNNAATVAPQGSSADTAPTVEAQTQASGSRIGSESGEASTAPGAKTSTVHQALDAHAAALGADPWLRTWPVLLREVVPVVGDAGWQVVDGQGAALPLAPGEQPWSLLAVSGGYPVSVFGEWTVDGLVPISVFAVGEIIDLASEPALYRDSPAPSGTTDDLISAALLGTARRTFDPARLPAPVAAAAESLRADPAFLLLESATLRDTFARGGIVPKAATVPPPAPDDDRAQLPRAAAVRLADMLRDRSRFLPEWFAAVAPHDFRAPDALAAQLLESADAQSGLREPLLRLAGERGRWLAQWHPEWRNLLSEFVIDTDSEEIWRYGSATQRRDWLARLRARDADAARAALTDTWATETGQVKAELLAVFADGIGAADEPLLETALDDRRAEVRRTAAGLLALLPDSAFAERMLRRAADWIVADADRTRLSIELPDPLDADVRRDGITDRAVEFSYRWNGVPDVTAGRLRQLVAATPLRHWAAALGAPEHAVRVAVDDRFRQPLFDGWVDAALAQQDSSWAAALFANGVPSDTALLRRRELFALLPVDERVRHLLRLDGAWLSELEALLPAVPHPWPQPLAQHVILLLFERARLAAQRTGNHGTGPAAHRSLLAAASVHLPVDAAATVASIAQRCDDVAWARAFDQLATDLTHRSDMLEELP
ncbi:hypothetical protein SAMN04244553_2202 [Nocardia amikacinitolerans]|uniref:SWIM-type domain-containing protein n=1 Tax=Nocardia amikacinitolerans TaxID=756689 RepID=A0A285LB71_9NOCA|nr:DUF5691 domain-containing protein [Nocardia amikacinitolerans]SNY80631.1 hypothetical protein SAMN04244553_2202 [Nocardia amikacinitolerans]